jgi:hypothetical protein
MLTTNAILDWKSGTTIDNTHIRYALPPKTEDKGTTASKTETLLEMPRPNWKYQDHT